MRPGERHCLLHPRHHPCPAPLIPTISLYNIPKSGSHLTRKRAHLGNAGVSGADRIMRETAEAEARLFKLYYPFDLPETFEAIEDHDDRARALAEGNIDTSCRRILALIQGTD